MYWHDMAWWAWAPMTIGMIIFWVSWRGWPFASCPVKEAIGHPQSGSARQILDARFARGEVGASEYEHARRLLERHAGSTDGPTGEGEDDTAPGRSSGRVRGRG